MIIVQHMVLFVVIIIIVTAGAEDASSELLSNNIEEVTQKAIKPREYNVEKQVIEPNSNYSQKIRRSRYLRQAPRPSRRRPPYDIHPRNIRRPPYPMYNPRNQFKPNMPMYRSPLPKSKYLYRDHWRQKWPEHNSPYGPYSAMDDDEIEPESLDEYDDMDSDFKNDEAAWYSKKYRDSYDDVMPVSSKYSEKRSPLRPYSVFHNVMEFSRSRTRPNYDAYDNFRKDLNTEWPKRNRFMKNYQGDYIDIIVPVEKLKKYADGYADAFSSDRLESHRFKLAANANRLKNLDDDEFDFSGGNGLKIRRYKNDPHERPHNEEHRYEPQYADVTKYLMERNPFSVKPENSQDVVYSAKYRGVNKQGEGKENNEKTNQEQLKLDDIHQTQTSTNEVDWKRNQQPVYQEYHLPDTTSTNVNTARSQTFKSDQLLPSELIAYMSADPAESVVGKEERYLESRYPYIDKFSDHDILKAAYPRKMSPVIDQDLEITFDERMSDWKH